MTRGSLIRDAWREWRDARAYEGTDEELHGSSRAPRWFIGIELGYDLGQAPSLSQTLARLAETNRRSRAMLGKDAPDALTRKRTNGHRGNGVSREQRGQIISALAAKIFAQHAMEGR